MSLPLRAEELVTFVEVFEGHAEERPDREALRFLDEGASSVRAIGYGELDRRARAVAAELSGRVREGDRALLLFPPGLEFAEAFLGCLYAGVVGVPCYPPRPRRARRADARVVGLARDADPAVVLTTSGLLETARRRVRDEGVFDQLAWIAGDAVPDDLADAYERPVLGPDTLAFLQYTSGSTGDPKGVMVRHRHLLANQRMLQEAFGLTAEDTVVGWLPLFHDMGLVGNFLHTLFLGIGAVLLPPLSFLQAPRTWLDAITRYRGTVSGGPNFAYDLCVRRIAPEDREGLDLSFWRIAFDGAETVRPKTMELFGEAFAPWGFRKSAFFPCYGLAEATLLVTGRGQERQAVVRSFLKQDLETGAATPGEGEGAVTLAGCGEDLAETSVAIVDPASGRRLPDRQVGEVWVRGASVAGGYWRKPDLSRESFEARLPGEDGPYLRTGDQGFLDRGELFLVGRLKDLVIIRGRNVYPQDVEATAEESHQDLRPASGAAFGVEEDGEERLVLVQELEVRRAGDAPLEAIAGAVREAVALEHRVQVWRLLLVRAGSVPKTSSGKVRRSACRAAYLAGSLEPLLDSRAATEAASPDSTEAEDLAPLRELPLGERRELLEGQLLRRLSTLRLSEVEIEPDQPLAAAGLDSLGAAELGAWVRRRWRVDLPLARLLEGPPVSEIALDLARAIADGAAVERIPRGPRPASGLHPMSAGQRSLYFLHRLAPESAAYHLARAARISTPVVEEALGRAFQGLVDRHAALRTTFEEVAGEPCQRVHRAMALPFEVVEAAKWSDETLGDRLAAESDRPFDLRREAPLRVRLYRCGPAESVLLLVVHHIVADLRSLEILLGELGALYAAEAGGPAAELAPLELELSDWVYRQQEWLSGPEARRALETWRSLLPSGLPSLELPLDRPRPAVQTFRGDLVSFRVPPHIGRRLRALCRARAATRFTGFLGLVAALLSRYTGQEEVVVGTPTSGRSAAGTDDLVGYFVNPVPLPLRIDGERSFLDLLDRSRDQALQAFEHAGMPFEHLVERLHLGREASRASVLQAMLVYQAGRDATDRIGPFALGLDGPAIELGGLTLRSLGLGRRAAQLDLTLAVAEAGETFEVAVEYNSDLFDRTTVERLSRHLRVLAEEALAAPERPVGRLALVAGEERRQILHGWNDTRSEHDLERPLHAWIADQARRNPEATAVELGDARMSYGELVARATALAAELRTLGVGPDTPVAVCVERSLDMMVGLLGVLQAGGAYLPLDPEYPTERLRLMLEDVGAPVLLTTRDLLPRLDHPEIPVVDLEHAPRRAPEAFVGPAVAPGSLAYVIYTSGSTGRPKGVLCSHAGIVNRLQWMQQAYRLTPDDAVLQKTPLGFDVSVWELFWPLMVGARLVVAPPGAHRDPRRLCEVIERHAVTVLHFVPSMLRPFLDEASVSACRSLRLVVCSGEALPPTLARRSLCRLGARLENLYGPTEASVDVTRWSCSPAALESASTVPIGRPIDNTRIHLLDRFMEPVPARVAGELFIAGAGLARGYHRRPALTAERFVPDPFDEAGGGRLYRTGDLARYRVDGAVEFLGRVDDQVKIRGQRVEPGEAAAALLAHPGVAEAAVVPWERKPGEVVLAAYVAPAGDPAPAGPELAAFLADRLPGSMVPAVFTLVDRLPLTPSGKLDRGSLRPPAERPAASGQGVTPPATEAERLLAGAWEEVLELDGIGRDQNFFALGGDSIKAISVVARARQRGLELSVEDLLRSQTVAELARAVRPAEPASPGHRRSPFELLLPEDRELVPEGVEDAYPLSLLQQGLVFHSELGRDYEIYVTSLRVRAAFERGLLERALEWMVRRHPILRTSFDMATFSEPVQLVWPSARIVPTVADWRGAGEAERSARLEEWVEVEKRRAFDWGEAPLVRVTVHRVDDSTFRLTLAEPLFDGWSVSSFLSELLSVYGRLLNGEELPAARPLAADYGDFVALEREALADPACRGFWDDFLARAEPSRLHRWAGAGSSSADGVRRVQHTLPKDCADRLRELAARAGTPVKSVLLAAHLKLMASLETGDQVLTGLIANGRPEVLDGDKVLGTHLNAVPVTARLEPESWLDLARLAFAVEREVHPYRRFPVAELQLRNERQRLFESVFNFTHFYPYDRVRVWGPVEVLDGYASEQTYYPLTVQCNLDHASGVIRLALDYGASDFHPSELRLWMGRLLRVLDAMAEDPSARHDLASLLSRGERHQVLREWSGGGWVASGGSVVRRVSERASSASDSVAVHGEEGWLSYGELWRRSGAVAGWLVGRGVGPEVRVGVCLERTVEMVVSVLGILRSGGAYVSLEPRQPLERLGYMLSDAGASWVVAEGEVARSLEREGFRVARPAEVAEVAEVGEPGESWSAREWAEGLAYLIYTSGSTGVPKGVGLTRGGLGHLVDWHLERYGLGPGVRMTQLAGLGFDAAVWEIWPALASGASLHLPAEPVRRSPEALREYLAREGIGISFLPTPLAEEVVSLDGGAGAGPSVVLTGGDRLRRHPPAGLGYALVNHYGPTENTVVATAGEAVAGAEGAPSIGRPIGRVEGYLLDRWLAPVAPGVAGELCLGGPGLARGYVGAPGATAERFVPDPWGAAGSRLYRTGDLARHRRDGRIDFLGRRDAQVKVRGFRIELGEVEAALASHPGVKASVCSVKGEGPGARLVAYAVPREPDLDLDDVRRHLSEHLPESMVPSALIALEELPLLASGKVDRRALPEPTGDDLRGGAAYVAPRTPLEMTVARVWSRVLGVQPVGLHDNFFQLGGHSLLATQVVSRLRADLKVDLPLPALFEAPTVGGLAEILHELLAEGGLPAGRAGQQAAALAPIDPLERVPGVWTVPMSFAQQRMWFIDQLEPRSCLYNEHGQLRFEGRLDVGRLHDCMVRVVARHESLRTLFATRYGMPMQVVHPEAVVELPVIDLGGLPEAARAAELGRQATVESRQPFDLAEGPLMRIRLVRMAAQEHYVFVTMHQIISDGWSVWVLTNEVAAIYSSLAEGDGGPPPPLRLQYPDFAHWQRELLQGDLLKDQLSYWVDRLASCRPHLELPVDRPHADVVEFGGANRAGGLSPEVSRRLKELSARREATPFVTMVAALLLLLHRYSRQTDLAVAVPVAGRNHVDLEGLIGFFVNVLVLRVDISRAATFADLMDQVHEAAVGAYANQDLPFDTLIEHLNMERHLRRQPFFDVLVNFNNLPRTPLSLPGLTISRVDLHDPVAKFPITVYVDESDGRFALRLLYQAELFSEARVASILDQYCHLLEQVVAEPDASLARFSLLTPESRQVLADPARSLEAPDLPPTAAVFLDRAAENPAAEAVRQGGRAWTYGELAEQAEHATRRLLAAGLQPGTVVAVTGPRSFGFFAAMIGTLLAGGVLLCLDPLLPEARRRVMRKEADARFLIRVGVPAEALEDGDTPLVEIETSPAEGFSEPGGSDGPLPAVAPADPAYVFFTSGTSAVPKGVLGRHLGLSHFLSWERSVLEVGPGDRCGQLTGVSFDVVLRDTLMPLTAGATLCLPEDPEDLAADRVLPWLESEGVTLLHTTPSIAQSWLVRRQACRPLPALRAVLFAGEPLQSDLVAAWRRALGDGGSIYNLYGPTETTLAKACYRVPSGAAMGRGVQPVGRAMPGAQLLILAEGGDRLCGPSEPGEIVIRTPYRTLGYLDESASARGGCFVPNPWSDDPDDLLYRSGDLGRYRPDGEVEILGRLDDQVKVRGVRVQPDEVAAAILRHPDLTSCAVVARGTGADKTLVAYAVASGEPPEAEVLRTFLSEHLPAAFVPTAFVFLEEIPLTANGKVDRGALPPPPEGRPVEDYLAPRSEVERALAAIWSRMLRQERVGVHDSFFALGGHSLLATQLMLETRETFGVDLPLRRLFETPTVAGLAAAVEEERRAAGRDWTPVRGLPQVEPDAEGRYEPFPLTDIQQAYWIGRSSNFELGNVATHNYSEFEFLDLEPERLEAAFDRLVRRHAMLRTVVRSDGTQCVLPEDAVPPYGIGRLDASGLAPEKAREAVDAIRRHLSHQVLPLDRWPLFELRVSRLDERRWLVHVSVDALICDAWSRRILGRELLQLYRDPDLELPAVEPLL